MPLWFYIDTIYLKFFWRLDYFFPLLSLITTILLCHKEKRQSLHSVCRRSHLHFYVFFLEWKWKKNLGRGKERKKSIVIFYAFFFLQAGLILNDSRRGKEYDMKILLWYANGPVEPTQKTWRRARTAAWEHLQKWDWQKYENSWRYVSPFLLFHLRITLSISSSHFVENSNF